MDQLDRHQRIALVRPQGFRDTKKFGIRAHCHADFSCFVAIDSEYQYWYRIYVSPRTPDFAATPPKRRLAPDSPRNPFAAPSRRPAAGVAIAAARSLPQPH